MADLSTDYMGFKLNNPLVVASSSLTQSVKGVQKCASAGAGAIVLKSLFEEQIQANARDLEQNSWLSGHPEAFDYIQATGIKFSVSDYLKLIADSKNEVSIPVIASLNCVSPRWWKDCAKQIEAAGADALELNISLMPSNPERTSIQIEKIYYALIEEVKASIKIPIAVKIGPYFTSMAHVAHELYKRGVSALVLFNRFYQFDIDTEDLELVPAYRFSSSEEISLSLRWISLLAGRIHCDLASSTGVHDGQGVIKQLLAGASAVQVCSTLYLNGVRHIGTILGQVDSWMIKKGFRSIEEIRGKLSQKESDRPELYERIQYIKALVGLE